MSRPCSHGLNHEARALAAEPAHSEESRWIVGTNSLRGENEVQVLAYDENKDAVRVVSTHASSSETWQLAPSPADATYYAAIHSTRGVFGASIFALTEGKAELDLRHTLDGHSGEIKCLRWHLSDATVLASVDESTLHVWSVTDESVKEASTAPAGTSYTFSTAALSGHDRSCCCTAAGSSLQVWDLRSMKKSSEKEAAHSAIVRDLDFARQTGNLLASCGDDCRTKVWDLRAISRPLTEAASHAHWVWQAKFNPSHDQLLLSSSSDAVVSLLHLPSLSAKKIPGAGRDGPVATFDAHEDTVHGVAWSAVDPWTFASLSYDGRFVINRVPSSVKYKILI